MKTLDRAYLATHPVGDEKAEVTLSHPVPDRIEVPDNPDGTRPKISLRVTGGTYLQVLTMLTALHEGDSDELVASFIDGTVTDEEMDRFGQGEDAFPYLLGRVQEIVTPFRTFEVGYELPEGAVAIAITAPSMEVAAQACVAMTGPRVLTSLAIGLCPEIEDEYSEGDEVLVVS